MSRSSSEEGAIDDGGETSEKPTRSRSSSGDSHSNSKKIRSTVNKVEYVPKKKDTSDKRERQNKDTKNAQDESITTRTGGAYIPPARLRLMQEAITDKSSMEYQRLAWEALKKSLNGHINKVNVSNLKIIVIELFKENMIRGRGLFARSVIQAQAASPTFTHVYAALVAVVNSKFPQIGELILKRLVIQFRRSYRRNDKAVCLTTSRFIAHLVNQQVAHELIALELVTLLLENCTNDSVEIAVAFLKEAGSKLTELTPKGIHAIFDRLRAILQEAEVDKRVQYMIEVMIAIRKDQFKDHPSKPAELDLVDEEDQFTHMCSLDDELDTEDRLNVFRFDPEYQDTEEKYKSIRAQILDESDDEDNESGDDSGSEDEEEEPQNGPDTATLVDATETDLVTLRRRIYLVIQSSLDFEECAHKLFKLGVESAEQVTELCHMVIDCCAQQRTYMKFYGLLAQRFCQIEPAKYTIPFMEIFKGCYDTIHRFETVKLRNVAKLFAHLLFTDAISWLVLSHIKLNEEDTTSSSRVFIKILFQEMAEYMGINNLKERTQDVTLAEAFAGLFPRDNPRNTRFAINFFTAIELGPLTEDLREHLKAMPKTTAPPDQNLMGAIGDSSDSDSSSSSSSSESSSGSESERRRSSRRQKSRKVEKKDRKHRKHSSESSRGSPAPDIDSGWALPTLDSAPPTKRVKNYSAEKRRERQTDRKEATDKRRRYSSSSSSRSRSDNESVLRRRLLKHKGDERRRTRSPSTSSPERSRRRHSPSSEDNQRDRSRKDRSSRDKEVSRTRGKDRKTENKRNAEKGSSYSRSRKEKENEPSLENTPRAGGDHQTARRSSSRENDADRRRKRRHDSRDKIKEEKEHHEKRDGDSRTARRSSSFSPPRRYRDDDDRKRSIKEEPRRERVKSSHRSR